MISAAAALPADRLVFDTADLPESEAFERYREFQGVGAKVSRIATDFAVRVEAWRLDGLIVYNRYLDGVEHRRDDEQVRINGFTHFIATLLLAGRLEAEMADGSVYHLSTPGEIILMDTGRPGAYRMERAHVVTCAIPRARLEAIVADVDLLAGVVLSAGHARLYRDFVGSLLETLPSLSAQALPIASGVVLSLLSTAIINYDAERHLIPSSRDGERMRDLMDLVDAHIADPGFDAAVLVELSDLSRATLYRLAEAEGGVATIIRTRRLERIRRHLNDPNDPRCFADIAAAAGMTRGNAAAAAFTKRYAITPARYRELVLREIGADASHKMMMWQEEVRPRRLR